MAACTFALSPSSAKVDVCKRRTLRLSSGSPASTQHRGVVRVEPASGERRGNLAKGLTESLIVLGKMGYGSDPLRPLRPLHGTVRRELQERRPGRVQKCRAAPQSCHP